MWPQLKRTRVYFTSVSGLLFVCLLLASCGSDSPSQEPRKQNNEIGDGPAPSTGEPRVRYPVLEIPDDAPRVTFLGDSISAGLHLEAAQAFPAVLQRQLFKTGRPFQLTNAGISGDTSAGGLARVDWLLKQAPDILVLELGVNDGMRGLPIDLIESNLRGIIEKTQAAGSQVLLLGVRIQPSYGEEYAEQIAAIYPRLAQEFDLPFVPFFMKDVGGVTELTLPDGLHPTALGQEQLAENVAPGLIALLDEMSAAD
jgi:acyl-CoA thioesterase-1